MIISTQLRMGESIASQIESDKEYEVILECEEEDVIRKKELVE